MWIDLLIVAAFVIYSVATGFVMQTKASRGLGEYFLAGRSLKGWQAGLSMAATQYAADTPLLVTGLIATAGVFSLWRLWVYAIAFLMMGFVLGACWRRAQILTDAEFTEIRYAGKGALILRAAKAVHMGTLVNCTVLAMVLLAATRIAEPFLIWHEWLPAPFISPLAGFLEHHQISFCSLPAGHPEAWIVSADNLISIACIVSFTTLYSTSGGLRSVVATDVVQFAVAMIATMGYAWVIVDRAGGVEGLSEKFRALYGPDLAGKMLSFGPPRWDGTALLFTAVLAVQWFAQVNADGTGYLAQRTMACETDREAKLAAVIFTVSQIVFRSMVWLIIGVGLLVLYPASPVLEYGTLSESLRMDREAVFVRGIKDFLPHGMLGLMLTGMLAALASTVDTHLNWGASYWANDIYKRLLMEKIFRREPGQRELVWVARLSNLGILTLALIIMANLNSIQSAWHLSLLLGSGLGAVLILRWLWHRVNLWSEVSAACVSFVLAPVLLFFFPGMDEGARLLIMVAVSTAGVLAVTLMTPPEPEETLVRFYLRVRPPGFWKRIARVACGPGENPEKKLLNSAAATLMAALSVFALLTGMAGLFFSGFYDHRIAFCLIAGGLFLVPLWWNLGMRDD